MGLFGQSTPFDAVIEKATSEKNTNENWSLILDVCDKVSSNPRNVKECLKAIMKRMCHNDPHVVMQAITLLDACSNNCGKPFHLEIASREFENEFRRLLTKAQPKVSSKMRQVLKNWVENDFKNDPELSLIPSLYAKLRQEGYDFSNLNEKPQKSAAKMVALKDPNVVGSQQEQDDIAKAIELSLKETKGSPSQHTTVGASSGPSAVTTDGSSTSSAYPSLYPSFSGSGSLGSINTNTTSATQQQQPQPEPRKVRALYDFEAAEENELTFFAGEIIHVLDDTDPNWWKGFNQRGDGLFPSNFVTADMSIDPESLDINQQNKSKKSVKFEDDAKELQQKTEAAAVAAANQPVEVDEAKIDRLLHLLHEANPEDPSQDSDEMVRFEQEVHQMGPLIDAELERVDRKHAQLTQLSSDLVDAINLYHSLMRDDRAALMGVGGGGAFMGGMPPGAMGYQGPPNPQMLYGAAGYPGASAGGSFPPQHTQMPQSYASMASSFGNTSTAVGGGTALQSGGYPPHMQMQMGSAGHQQSQQQQQMPIPMQFQNGHVNSPQLNGGMNNALPQHMSSPMGPGNQQPQQQMYGTPQQPGQQQPHPLPPSTQQHPQNYQMLAQQHQYSQQQQQQQPQTTTAGSPAVPNTANVANNPQQQSAAAAAPPQQQQQQQQLQQFISPQHQQQPHAPYMPNAQYGPMMNGPQSFMTPPPGMMQQLPLNNNNNGGDQFSQMQQQMAAVSMGINQPVTQNFETKNNIPIYQQR